MRVDGYAPIRDYAVIGDGRTAALVATDGAIDWLCLPNLDSPSVFAAILDKDRGGAFTLQPDVAFTSARRYVPDTNVLETVFTTDAGSVRVVDALTLPGDGLSPERELVRSIEGLSGSVPMRWRCRPRFNYGAGQPRPGWRAGVPVATWGSEAIGLCARGAGSPAWEGADIVGHFEATAGQRSQLVLVSADGEPLVLSAHADAERRLDRTVAFWREWTGARTYAGPWRDIVSRSALALKLMIFAPSGAAAASVTTSLPEEIGGQRNWDYRFCWIRDSNFIIDALLELGCYDEAKALFWWFMQATALTEPRLHVLYTLDGGVGRTEREVALSGYRGSRPVRVGNGAVDQLQLDIYGDLLQTAWLYSRSHHALDSETGTVLARIADYVCDIWRRTDAGIWEVRSAPQHFTHSKVLCWVALDRAIRLAERGELPAGHLARWRTEARAIEQFVNERCWSDRLNSYTRSDSSELMDAALLMLPILHFGGDRPDRINGTIDAVSSHLGNGPFIYRYKADDGLTGTEGCFVNCSFWLVGALARVGRTDEAARLMDDLVGRANDVGLFAEEIDPHSGAFLGNFPQALVHLALVDAAVAIQKAEQRR